MTTTQTAPTVTTRDAGTVTLGATTYTVSELLFSAYHDAVRNVDVPAASNYHLTGPRGAVYFLRGYLGPDTGVRQVISWKSGNPLRVRGNEVRVVVIGDHIEKYEGVR